MIFLLNFEHFFFSPLSFNFHFLSHFFVPPLIFYRTFIFPWITEVSILARLVTILVFFPLCSTQYSSLPVRSHLYSMLRGTRRSRQLVVLLFDLVPPPPPPPFCPPTRLSLLFFQLHGVPSLALPAISHPWTSQFAASADIFV